MSIRSGVTKTFGLREPRPYSRGRGALEKFTPSSSLFILQHLVALWAHVGSRKFGGAGTTPRKLREHVRP